MELIFPLIRLGLLVYPMFLIYGMINGILYDNEYAQAWQHIAICWAIWGGLTFFRYKAHKKDRLSPEPFFIEALVFCLIDKITAPYVKAYDEKKQIKFYNEIVQKRAEREREVKERAIKEGKTVSQIYAEDKFNRACEAEKQYLRSVQLIKNDVEEYFSNGANILYSVFGLDGKKLHYRKILCSRAIHQLEHKEKSALRLAFLLFKEDIWIESTLLDFIHPIIFNNADCNLYLPPKSGETVGDIKNHTILAVTLQQNYIISSSQAVAKIFSYVNEMESNNSKKLFSLSSGNKFLELSEIPTSKTLTTITQPYNFFLGRFEDKPIFYGGEKGILTIAPQGSGKTLCGIIPNLKRFEGSAIILDIKGECYRETADIREKSFGKVFRFSPENTAKSSFYNPLDMISRDDENMWEDAEFLAELLSPTENSDSNWARDAQEILSFAIVFLLIMRDSPTLFDVAYVIAGDNISEAVDHVVANPEKFPRVMQIRAAKFANIFDKAPKQWEAAAGEASANLKMWSTPKMEKITSRSDWHPEDFREAGTSLYLCISMQGLETYSSVLRLLISQHIRNLLREGQDEKFKETSSPIVFFLDEFTQLGEVKDFSRALEVGRSFGLRLWMVTQSLQQLQKAYPKSYKTLQSLSGVEMYMNPSSDEAEYLSKRLGQSTSLVDEIERPLLEPHELSGREFENKIVTFVQGESPLILEKLFDSDIDY